MTIYLDSSALVKRYLDEAGSGDVEQAMQADKDWTSSRITFVETLRAIPVAGTKSARRDWSEFYVVDVDEPLCERAVSLANQHNLKSLDAIHLASGLIVRTDDLTFATWDRRLHTAARAEGIATLPASLS